MSLVLKVSNFPLLHGRSAFGLNPYTKMEHASEKPWYEDSHVVVGSTTGSVGSVNIARFLTTIVRSPDPGTRMIQFGPQFCGIRRRSCAK